MEVITQSDMAIALAVGRWRSYNECWAFSTRDYVETTALGDMQMRFHAPLQDMIEDDSMRWRIK